MGLSSLELLARVDGYDFVQVTMGRVAGRRETESGEGTRDEEVELAVLADFRRGRVVGVVESAGGNVVRAGEVAGEC